MYGMSLKQIDRFLFGYTRDKKGMVINYHPVKVANTIHTFTGGGWTTDQFAAIVYETD